MSSLKLTSEELIELAKQDLDPANDEKFSIKEENMIEVSGFLNSYRLLDEGTTQVKTYVLYYVYSKYYNTEKPIIRTAFYLALGKFTKTWGIFNYNKHTSLLTPELIKEAELHEAKTQLGKISGSKHKCKFSKKT